MKSLFDIMYLCIAIPLCIVTGTLIGMYLYRKEKKNDKG